MDNIPPALPTPEQPFQPAPPRNWWGRNWLWVLPTGCLTLLALFAAFIGGILMFVTFSMRSSNAYQTSLRKAAADERVIEALGSPVTPGFFVSGSVSVSGGSGNADISFPLKGPKGKATLFVKGTKEEGSWSYSRMDVRVESTGARIDLRTIESAR